MTRGITPGVPPLILPIIANYIGRKNQTKSVLSLIMMSGILIIVGGWVMAYDRIIEGLNVTEMEMTKNIEEMEDASYDPTLFEAGTLFAVSGFQILISMKRLKKPLR